MPYLRQGSAMPHAIPAAIASRIARMRKLPNYVRTHGTGDYFSLATPMPMSSPLYMSAGQMGLTSNQAGRNSGLGCGSGGGCTCGGACKNGGLGFTMPTDWSFQSSSIADSLGIGPFATSYPVIGTDIPNWVWYALAGAIALGVFKGR